MYFGKISDVKLCFKCEGSIITRITNASVCKTWNLTTNHSSVMQHTFQTPKADEIVNKNSCFWALIRISILHIQVRRELTFVRANTDLKIISFAHKSNAGSITELEKTDSDVKPFPNNCKTRFENETPWINPHFVGSKTACEVLMLWIWGVNVRRKKLM